MKKKLTSAELYEPPEPELPLPFYPVSLLPLLLLILPERSLLLVLVDSEVTESYFYTELFVGNV
jgi:hypothetical protein